MKYFASYSVDKYDEYFYRIKVNPSLQTPPADYTFIMLLYNLTDSTSIRPFTFEVQVKELIITKNYDVTLRPV